MEEEFEERFGYVFREKFRRVHLWVCLVWFRD